MSKSVRLASIGKDCVACGCCLRVCPKGAIAISTGIRAQIKSELCVGCGKCVGVCPAAVITLINREGSV